MHIDLSDRLGNTFPWTVKYMITELHLRCADPFPHLQDQDRGQGNATQ